MNISKLINYILIVALLVLLTLFKMIKDDAQEVRHELENLKIAHEQTKSELKNEKQKVLDLSALNDMIKGDNESVNRVLQEAYQSNSLQLKYFSDVDKLMDTNQELEEQTIETTPATKTQIKNSLINLNSILNNSR